MRKPPTQAQSRKNIASNKLALSSEEDSKSFRALQLENQRLRDLVAYLSAAVLGNNIPLSHANGPGAVSGVDAKQLSHTLDVLTKPFPGHELLTPRERLVLAQIVNGASNKEAGQILVISTRTVEFHRANILFKLAAKNTAELMRIVLSE